MFRRVLWFAALLAAFALAGLAGAGPTAGHSPFPEPVARWSDLVVEAMPDEQLHEVLAVIECESYGNPDAVNPSSGTTGLLQIHPGWLTGWSDPIWAVTSHDGLPVDLADPWTNLTAARLIRAYESERGLEPWSNWECRP